MIFFSLSYHSLNLVKISFLAKIFFILGFLLVGFQLMAIDYEGKTVEQILVEGSEEVSEGQIKRFLSFQEGSTLTQKSLRKALSRLFRANFLEDIKFDITEGSEGGIVVKVIVKSHLEINNFFLVGNESLSDFNLLEEVTPEQKKYFTRSKMNTIKFLIINKYLEKGYLDVSVDYEERPSVEYPDMVDVIFAIREGSAYYTKKINFTGNSNVPAEDILGFLQTKEDTFFTTGLFNPVVFQIDKERIVYVFRTKGYYKAQILGTDFNYTWNGTEEKDKKYVSINVDMEEGELYYFGSLKIRGNTLFSDEELLFDTRREEGEIFNQATHDQDIASIYQKYHQNGYIFARITPIETIDSSNRINFVLDIYEGDKAHIEKIVIRGLSKTEKKVVLRELQIREGEIFDVERIKLSLYRLNRLDYFSKIKEDYRTGSAEGLMNLELILKDKSTGKLSGGFTYGLSSGFSLIAEYSDRNFLGKGFFFSGKARFGFNVKDLSVSFTDPWFLNEPISFGGSITLGKFNLEYRQDLYPVDSDGNTRSVESPDGGSRGFVNNSSGSIQYTRDKIAFSVFSGQRFINWYEFSQSFGMEFSHDYLYTDTIWPENYSQYSLYEKNQDLFSAPPPIDNPWRITYIFGLGISRDSRNSLINPTEGRLHSLKLKSYLGGYDYIDWELNNQFYETIGWRSILFPSILWKSTLVYKSILRTLGNSILDDFDNDGYYEIGKNSLRGWDYNSILSFRRERFGTDSLLDNRAQFQSYILHTFEFRQNLATDLLQGVLFMDFAGASSSKLSILDSNSWGFLVNFSDFMNSFGFGLRINFPQLPIRLYGAWRYVYDSGFRLYNQQDKVPVFIFDFEGVF